MKRGNYRAEGKAGCDAKTGQGRSVRTGCLRRKMGRVVSAGTSRRRSCEHFEGVRNGRGSCWLPRRPGRVREGPSVEPAIDRVGDVIFKYIEREVDPLPGETGLQSILEPIIPIRLIGPSRTYIIHGLLDTGASITLVPVNLLRNLGLTPRDAATLATAAGPLQMIIGAIDIELRSGRTICRWSARVGFVPRADNKVLLGHDGFLDHFTATFDGFRKRVTLRPNGTFPAPTIISR
jgi:hypothetical protein